MGNLSLEGISPSQIQDALRTEDIVPYRRARAEAIATFERRYLSHLIEATGATPPGRACAAGMDRPYLLSCCANTAALATGAGPNPATALSLSGPDSG